MHRSTTLIALIVTAMLAAGCGDDPAPPTAPTPPDSIVEVIDGTLTPLGARIHAFQVLNAGTVNVSLTEIEQPDPDVATVVALDLGTWNGVVCQITVARPAVVQGGGVTGTATAAGSLCVRISDDGARLPASVIYKLTVTHF